VICGAGRLLIGLGPAFSLPLEFGHFQTMVAQPPATNHQPRRAKLAFGPLAALCLCVAPMAALHARVASGELPAAANVDGAGARPDHHGCVPKPVSMIPMTSGLLGLIGARRFKK